MSSTITYKDKFQRKYLISASGIICDDAEAKSYNVVDEGIIRVVTENAPVGTEVTIKAKINNQDSWTVLGTVTDSNTDKFDLATWDRMQVECTAYVSDFDIIMSGFPAQASFEENDISVEIENLSQGIEPATDPKITELTMATNVENSHTFRDNTKRIQINHRNNGASSEIELSWVTGLPGADHIIIEKGAIYFQDNLDITGVTVYLRTANAGTIQIEEWL